MRDTSVRSICVLFALAMLFVMGIFGVMNEYVSPYNFFAVIFNLLIMLDVCEY